MTTTADKIAELSRRNAELEAENARLKVTLVEAAIPLEAMLLSGAANQVSNDLRKGIVEAVQKVRQALGEKNDAQ